MGVEQTRHLPTLRIRSAQAWPCNLQKLFLTDSK